MKMSNFLPGVFFVGGLIFLLASWGQRLAANNNQRISLFPSAELCADTALLLVIFAGVLLLFQIRNRLNR